MEENNCVFEAYPKLGSRDYLLLGINGVFDTPDAKGLFEDIAEYAMSTADDEGCKEILLREMKPAPDEDITELLFWKGALMECRLKLLNKCEERRVTHWATPESLAALRERLLEAV